MTQANLTRALAGGFIASNTPQPLLFAPGTLMGHFIYGAILGSVAGTQAQRAARDNRFVDAHSQR